jgi:hypothetical protein
MFNDYQEDFKAQEEKIAERSKSVNPVMVGSAPIKVLAINPTEDQLVDLIGEGGKKFDTRYQKSPSLYNDNKPSRPVSIWITDGEDRVAPTLLNFNLVDTQQISSNENPRWWTAMVGEEWAIFTTRYSSDMKVGNSIEKTSGANNTYTETVLAECRVGEEAYYQFLYTLLKWPNPLTFFEAMKKNKIDFDTVFEGDFSGLHNLIGYLNEPIKVEVGGEITEQANSKTLMGIFTAKQSKSGYMKQSIIMDSDLWFVDSQGILTSYMLKTIEKLQKSKFEYDGSDITKDEYTLEPLVEYSKAVVKKKIAATDDVEDWTNY